MQKLGLPVMAGILSLVCNPTYAKNHALQMGGNCEKSFNREDKKNIFLSPMSKVRNALSSQWEVTTLYDENTSFFQDSLKKKAKEGSVKPSSKKAFFDELDRLIADTSHPTPGQNDQVMLLLDAHGLSGEICISEDERLSYDDPELTKRLDKLKKNAKLAFINEACFSGSSIKSFGKYGCTLTGQGTQYFSFGSPISDVLMDESKHLSLSDLYLKVLANRNPLTFPQLSSFDEGLKLTDNFLAQIPNGPGLEVGMYLSDACRLSRDDGLDSFKKMNILDLISKDDQKQLKKYFGKDLKSCAQLQKEMDVVFDPKLKESYSVIADKIAQLVLKKNFTQTVVLPAATWFHFPPRDPDFYKNHPKYDADVLMQALDEAQKKASAISGVECGTYGEEKLAGVKESGLRVGPTYGTTDKSTNYNKDEWTQHTQLYLDTLRSELAKNGVNPDDIVDSQDSTYKDAVKETARREIIMGNEYRENEKQTKELSDSLDALDVKFTLPESYQQMSQLLGYHYLQSKQSPSNENKAKQKACDDFVIFN
jgi:hypothetical protein